MIFRIRKKMQDGNHMSAIHVEEAEEHVCLNCGTRFRGNYCPGCRQKASVHRLNIKDTLKNGFGRFTKLDSGFLHTMIHLLYRPGFMVRDYINGYRTEYVDPLMLLFILVAIELFLPSPTGEALSSGMPENYNALLATHPFSLKLVQTWFWIFGDMQRAQVFMGGLFALAVVWTQKPLRLKGKGLNLSESFHLILYALCYVNFLGIVQSLVYLAIPSVYAYDDDISSVLSIVLIVLIYIMEYDNVPMKWWKFVLFIVLYPIFISIVYVLLLVVIQIALKIDLPNDIYKQIDVSTAFDTIQYF